MKTLRFAAYLTVCLPSLTPALADVPCWRRASYVYAQGTGSSEESALRDASRLYSRDLARLNARCPAGCALVYTAPEPECSNRAGLDDWSCTLTTDVDCRRP